MKFLTAAAALLVATSLSSLAHASTTIDFDEYAHAGVAKVYNGPILADGFSFTPDTPTSGLGFWGAAAGGQNADPDGAALLFWNTKSVTVTRTDGAFFSLKSLALADTANSGFPSGVRFSFFDGVKTTTQEFNLDKLKGLQTINFDQARLQSFTYAYVGTQGLQLDDVVVDAPASAAVPEPATWAMMILGFGAAGSVLRRRRMAIA